MDRRTFLASSASLIVPSLGWADSPPDPKAPPFKLGIVSYMIPAKWDLPTTLRVCKEVGLAAVECRTTHKHGVEPTLSANERKKVKAQFADSGIVFWGSGTVCEFHSVDPKVVQKNIEDCKKFIQLVADIGGVGVKVRPNGLPKEVKVEKTLEQIGKALIECGKAAQNAGVEIWVEVHGVGTQDPPHMKTIMEVCNHPSVGITWNSNPTDIKDGSIKEAFEMLKKWIKSCHINDLNKQDAPKDKGFYPYRELFQLLREIKYNRYTLIEEGKAIDDPNEGIEYLKKYKRRWLELAQG
jgi:sugar phosphate isomerase/epimerase